MKYIITILLFVAFKVSVDAQSHKQIKFEIDSIKQIQNSEILKRQTIKSELKVYREDYEKLSVKTESLISIYEQTNDRLDNYLTFTAIVASIFGVLIALAGIYIGFESLRSQNRRKEAIKTLEDAKLYVNGKKSDFDNLIEEKKGLLTKEYQDIIDLLKDKLLNDIEFETSKVKSIAEQKSKEIESYSLEEKNNKTLEILENRIKFFENIGIPDDPDILFSKGKILYEKEMYEDSITLFEKLISKDPEHKNAYWYLGYAYAKLNKTDESIKNYEKHLKIKPDDSSALNNISLRFKEKGDPLKSLEYINKAIVLNESKELYFKNRISIYKQLKSNDKIIEDYHSLIKVNPDNKEYYDSILTYLKEKELHEEILKIYDKAENHYINQNENITNEFIFSRALYLGNKSEELESIQLFQGLIDKEYKTEHCYIQIANLKDKIGKTEEAISILENAIRSSPLSSSLYIYKSQIQSKTDIDLAKNSIDEGGQAINSENFYFVSGRFFNKKKHNELSVYSYLKASEFIKAKLDSGKLEEGDLLNYFESLIIAKLPLDEFNANFRSSIKSDKYLKTLNIIELLATILNEDEEILNIENLVNKIKDIDLSSYDAGYINWNFDDLYWMLIANDKIKGAKFLQQISKYLKKEIKIDELMN